MKDIGVRLYALENNPAAEEKQKWMHEKGKTQNLNLQKAMREGRQNPGTNSKKEE